MTKIAEMTPLMHAWYLAPDNVLEGMINAARMENIEHENKLGWTILHYLAFFACVSALRCALLKTNNKVNGRTKLGRTPLHYCVVADQRYKQQCEIAVYLMEYNASKAKKDKDGKLPLDVYNKNICSKEEEKKELRKLLLVPAQIKARGKDAITVFINKIENGKITMVKSRVMFLGKEEVGKTSFVNAILGKALDKNEPSTDCIITTTVFQTVGELFSKWKEQKMWTVLNYFKYQLKTISYRSH